MIFCNIFTEDLQILCYLNSDKKDQIQSIFYNSLDESFVTVSIRKTEQNVNENNMQTDFIQLLHCRSTKVKDILMGNYNGTIILENEEICFPGWLEFDEQNHRILTFNHSQR